MRQAGKAKRAVWAAFIRTAGYLGEEEVLKREN